jgi:uncharacterized protein (TIGR02444 family)
MSESFWTFSLRFYQLEGVAERCLELQDRYGTDVNLVLFALWAASSGRVLDVATIAAAERTARPWREAVTQPLRAARRALKTRPDGFDEAAVAVLRAQVMATELEAERLQQDAMATRMTVEAHDSPFGAARQNLRRYEALLGTPLGAGPIERLLDVFDAEFRGTVCSVASDKSVKAPL